MIQTKTLTNQNYLQEQIKIMYKLLEQVTDRYALARIKLQLGHLETELEDTEKQLAVQKI